MLIARQFIELLVQKYGCHPVYCDRGTWYLEVCNVLGLKHYLHSPYEKSIVERVNQLNQYFKGRIEGFDEYYPCNRKSNCDLKHTLNWISFFILMYNDINNHRLKIELGG